MRDPEIYVVTVVDPELKHALSALELTKNSVRQFSRDACHLIIMKDQSSELNSKSECDFPFSMEIRSLVCLVNDAGIYDAFNFAIKNLPDDSNVFFLNAGDLMVRAPELLKLSQRVRKEEKLWGYGRVIMIDNKNVSREYSFPRFNRTLLKLGLKIVHQQGTVYSVRGLRLIGGFESEHKIAADMLAHYKLAQLQNPLVIKSCISIFPLGGISARSRSEHFSDWKEILKSQHQRDFFLQKLLNPLLVMMTRIRNKWKSNHDYI